MKLIKGNHDQLYLILYSNFNYYETLPLWIKESIDWTIENTDLDNYEIEYDWLDNYLHDDMFFAHANPFKYGD